VLKRADGGEVIAIRDLELVADGGLPRVVSANRVAFRSMVRPGDGLTAEVTIKA
jgi:3-hydroxymyristoyl/3-hydroxydecanoyl-(acyl carrier protein) dehydratase